MVESSRIKKAIEACYTGVLPKGTSPFIYLRYSSLFLCRFRKNQRRFHSIQLDPTTVDVNVHPTKREVHFLEEEGITESIADAIQAKLAQSGERTFEYQVGVHLYLLSYLAIELASPSRPCSPEASLPQTLGKERRERTKTTRAVIPHRLLPQQVPPPLRKFSHNTKSARLAQTEHSTRCFSRLRRNLGIMVIPLRVWALRSRRNGGRLGRFSNLLAI